MMARATTSIGLRRWERLVVEKGLSDPSSLSAREEVVADAYRHTPHGKPVELEGE